MKRVTAFGTRCANGTRPSRTLFLASRAPLAHRAVGEYLDTGQRLFSSANITARQTTLASGATAEPIESKSAAPVRDGEDPMVRSPAPRGELSIVFTDIVKSTAIWEANTPAMTRAMQIHDSIIRKATSTYQGYEVKQNGDGFMIAFPTVTSAIQFCLHVQQQLLDTEWPPTLMELRPGEESTDNHGNVLFRGLRLRMSAHWGTPVCNWNEVIERMDYLGPMVNRAARFIEVTEGGQIVVSEEFLSKLQDVNGDREGTSERDSHQHIAPGKSVAESGQHSHPVKVDDSGEMTDLKGLRCTEGQSLPMSADQQFEVRPLGKHEFKGLTEPQKLYFIIPQSLHGRLKHWPKHYHVRGSKGNLTYSSG